MSYIIICSKGIGADRVSQEKSERDYYTIEREFLGKITIEEFAEKIIKIHLENNDNQIEKSEYIS